MARQDLSDRIKVSLAEDVCCDVEYITCMVSIVNAESELVSKEKDVDPVCTF